MLLNQVLCNGSDSNRWLKLELSWHHVAPRKRYSIAIWEYLTKHIVRKINHCKDLQLCSFQDFINELTLYLYLDLNFSSFGSHSHSHEIFWRKLPSREIDAVGTALAITWPDRRNVHDHPQCIWCFPVSTWWSEARREGACLKELQFVISTYYTYACCTFYTRITVNPCN